MHVPNLAQTRKKIMKFRVDDKVVFCKTGSELDGISGTILGTAAEFAEMAMYIVMMDEPLTYSEAKAIVITEHCINKKI